MALRWEHHPEKRSTVLLVNSHMIKKLISLLLTLSVLSGLASCSRTDKLKIGDKIEFGNYKGYKAWRVLDVEGSEALLITEGIVDKYVFDGTYNGWESDNCDIRNWLNTTFIGEAFSDEERNKIVNKTGDDVFLLSIEEAYRYFKDDNDRILSTGDDLGWWLRSKGAYPDHAAVVDTSGLYPGIIDDEGGLVFCKRGVRPAVWIKLDHADNGDANVVETVSDCGCFTLRKTDSDTYITGLTEKGLEEEELLIPAGAEIFCCINEGKAKTVSFKSDNDIDYGHMFTRMQNLETIKLPANLTKLGWLSTCPNLKETDIPEGVTVIPVNCFLNDSKLETVTVRGNLTEIRCYAFGGCQSLKTIDLPDSVTTIDSFAFAACESLKEVTLPKNLKKAGERIFGGSGVKTITVPQELQLEKWNSSSFDTMTPDQYTVKVVKGSWADIHFDEVFTGNVSKEYY